MSDEGLIGLFFLVILPVCLLGYFVPTMIASARRHPNRWAILGVNLVLGGTGLGWVGSLVWALHAVHRAPMGTGTDGGESGLNLFANDVQPVRLIEDGSSARGLSGAILPPAVALAEIERLGALRAAGHLSEAEFARLKTGVLARLA